MTEVVGQGRYLNTKCVYVLGKKYDNDDEIKKCCHSFFRYTYRRDLPILSPYNYTSDSGWGCMIRVCQMLMASAFKIHFFGKDWTVPVDIEISQFYNEYKEILRWFVDYTGPPHYYSLHHMVQAGMSYNILPGEWYGPSTASLVLRDLCKLHRRIYQGPLEILVTQNDTIYISDAESICSKNVNCRKDDYDLNDNDYDNDNDNDNEDFSYKNDNETFDTESEFKNGKDNNNNNNNNNNQNNNNYNNENDNNENDNNEYDNNNGSGNNTKDDSEVVPKLLAALKSIKENRTNRNGAFFDPLFNPPPVTNIPWTCGLIVIIPLMLGLNTINDHAVVELKEALRHKYSLGFVGGRPNHAIYFVGYNSNNQLLGLDPHTVYGNTSLSEPFPSVDYMNQIHVNDFITLDFNRLDPNIALAFYFRNRTNFDEFCRETKIKNEKKISMGLKPLYTIQQQAPSYASDINWNPDGNDKDIDNNDDDDYVLV